jgi:putative sigma-54 modulation protein
MKITIQSLDFTPAKKLISFVEDKVGKLGAISPLVQEARVGLKIDKSDTKENKISEIKLVIPGNDLFATRKSASFEESVMATIDALKHQLARLKSEKEKQRSG